MKQCNVIGCSEKHYCKGLCQKHYMQQIRGTLKEPIKDVDSLLESLKSYEDIISSGVKHNNQRLASLFSLLESLISES